MQVHLAYGEERIEADLPDQAVVLRPQPVAGLADEHAAFLKALENPIGSAPLSARAYSGMRVAIVTADITRPMPSDRILPWLLEVLHGAGVGYKDVVLINGTGSHRGNTEEEFKKMYGPDIVARYRIINHDAYDKQTLCYLGKVETGAEVWLNKAFVEADFRIVTGFVEPHFFAGFSGGAKGIFPGIAGIDSIMHFHNAAMIGHPKATWGVLEGNPLQEEARAVWNLVQPEFLVNVTLNTNRQLTGIFCGTMPEAFEAGAAFEKKMAMVPVDEPFDVVVTTNSGYPLDQNLYQTVKGMSAAAEIVRPGGTILCVSECREGFPDHGRFKELLQMQTIPKALLAMIESPGFHAFDQWEAQKLATILLKARVLLYSSMPDETVRAAMLTPVAHIQRCVDDLLRQYGPKARIAVLPDGPLTIPYLRPSVHL
ncbi:MAG: nickel-dependent lactate racemase [Firmicutes bacterium]|nr:nickel-dependent lactate racemase [Bacillota bacterium]